MIVMKFGGTSVGDSKSLRQAAEIIKRHKKRQPVVVVSAMGGITDLILSAAHLAAARKGDDLNQTINSFKERHLQALRAVVSKAEIRERLVDVADRFTEELNRMLLAMNRLGKTTERMLDAAVSFGEKLLAEILAGVLQSEDIPARALNAQKFIVTDDTFGGAAPLKDVTHRRCAQAISPLLRDGVIPVITGFIGSTKGGIPTTLGRGGSDYSAAIIGAALNVKEIWIYTDVDGILSADPKVVPGSIALDELSYHEVTELSYFGARVVHPKTVFPAIERRIPIRIKNTFNPSFPGTRIVRRASPTDQIVKAVASIDHLSLITVEGTGMLGTPQITARVFDVIARQNVNVVLIAQASSQQSICFVVQEKDAQLVLKGLRQEFAAERRRGAISEVYEKPGLAVIAVVGEHLQNTPGVAGRLCCALRQERINVMAMAQSSSKRSLSLAVSRNQQGRAVRCIHKEFIG